MSDTEMQFLGRNQSIIWTADATEQLIALWKEGYLSVSQIGSKLGCSRNAVVGKVFRLRKDGILEGRKVGVRPDGSASRQNRPRKVRAAKARRAPNSLDIRRIAPRIVEAPLVAPDAGSFVDITALERHHCREVMVMEPRPLYCGATKKDGSSFCSFHHAKNWQLPDRRWR
jgi:hypothetical protein